MPPGRDCDVHVRLSGKGRVSAPRQVISRKGRITGPSVIGKKTSAMASSVSGDQSLSLSILSGRTTPRLSSVSLEEQDAMAMPSIIMAESGERIVLADGDTVEHLKTLLHH